MAKQANNPAPVIDPERIAKAQAARDAAKVALAKVQANPECTLGQVQTAERVLAEASVELRRAKKGKAAPSKRANGVRVLAQAATLRALGVAPVAKAIDTDKVVADVFAALVKANGKAPKVKPLRRVVEGMVKVVRAL